ncbi:MAG: serine/threonine protein kinase [Myxococcales bacterium]|nr:serine/threonine protein kinase [Myxococcales bacterium]
MANQQPPGDASRFDDPPRARASTSSPPPLPIATRPPHPPLQRTKRGEAFGPYRVFERLGAGGMATVHRAYHQPDGGPVREVALKRLLPHLADDESFVRAFVREAKLASLLEHPGIVKIYELGRVGGTYFISMQYVVGHDLRGVLRQARRIGRQPPLSVALCLAQQMLQALDYAHRSRDLTGEPLGIVHRDVSPANLLVDQQGHLTMIDFGIAKAQTQQFLTHTGRVKGKLAYMAPETAMGQAIDARSDIFSAGIVLHELLTVRPLFACKNEYETLQKLQRCDVPPPSTRNGAVPPELDAIVLRALAKKPSERFATASEFAHALADFAARRRLRSTPLEVQRWCEWLFSEIGHAAGTNEAIGLSPETTQWRRPTATLANAYAELVPHNDTDEIDVIVEELWDRPQPLEAVPVVIDDVPDVSSRVAAPAEHAPKVVADRDPLKGVASARARTTSLSRGLLQGSGVVASRPMGASRARRMAVMTALLILAAAAAGAWLYLRQG